MITDEATARSWLETLPEATDQAMGRLDHFAAMLRSENGRQNLVSADSLHQVWQRHIADSAQLLRFVPRETSEVLDLGSGAGLPGIVIAALRPRSEIVLVESRKRRVEWLNSACAAIGLHNVKVFGSLLERVKTRNVGVIAARAFAPLDKLIELSARFSTTETLWVLPKGRSAQQEVNDLRGWDHTFHVEQSITSQEAGIIVGSLYGRKDQTS